MAKPIPAPKPLNIKGSSGNDTLGGALGDTIDGGKSNDTLIGNGGADTLVGGLDADTFRYLAFSNSRAWRKSTVSPISAQLPETRLTLPL